MALRRTTRIVWMCSTLACSAVAVLEACWYDVPDVVTPSEGGADVVADVLGDAGVVDDGSCNLAAPFGPAVAVQGLALPGYDERFARFTTDELTAYVAIAATGQSTFQLYSATRPSVTAPFGGPVALVPAPPANASDNNITVTPDGLTALLSSTRPNSDTDASQLWSATRTSTSTAFGNLNWSTSTYGQHNGDLDPYFVDEHIYYSVYVASAGAPMHIGSSYFPWISSPDASEPSTATINSSTDDRAPVLTVDDRQIFFASRRGIDGGAPSASFRVWTSTRSSRDLTFVAPSNVSELNGLADPRPSWISADGCRLYLTVSNAGSDDVFMAKRGK